MNEKKLTNEINEHIDNPKNYGQIYPHNGVGMGFNPNDHKFVIFYLHVKDSKIQNIGYGVSADEDAITLASMFSEMVKGDTLKNSKETLNIMKEQIQGSAAAQQKSAKIVLASFEAALINHKNLKNGIKEDMFKLPIEL